MRDEGRDDENWRAELCDAKRANGERHVYKLVDRSQARALGERLNLAGGG